MADGNCLLLLCLEKGLRQSSSVPWLARVCCPLEGSNKDILEPHFRALQPRAGLHGNVVACHLALCRLTCLDSLSSVSEHGTRLQDVAFGGTHSQRTVLFISTSSWCKIFCSETRRAHFRAVLPSHTSEPHFPASLPSHTSEPHFPADKCGSLWNCGCLLPGNLVQTHLPICCQVCLDMEQD